MKIIGINAYHPDASVVLLDEGVLVWAAEEERFNRIKHTSGFPQEALQKCFQDTGLHPNDIDIVALSKNPKANLFRKVRYSLRTLPTPSFIMNRIQAAKKSNDFKLDYMSALNIKSTNSKFIHVEHHRAHIASAFFCSGYENAAFLSFDGLGDFVSAMWGSGNGNNLNIMNRVYFPHSAGFLYTATTQFMGFLNYGDEYKVMGLAAYGKPSYLDALRKLVRLFPDGTFELNLDYFQHHRGQSKVRWEGGAPEQDIIYSPKWVDVFGQARIPKSEMTIREHDMAASLQTVLEEIYFHILNHLYKSTKTDNLCMAGGVAYNSLANGKIAEKTPFKNIYIQPAAGDSGTALGAALYVYRCLYKEKKSFKMEHAYFGPDYSDSIIEEVLKKNNVVFEKLTEDKMIDRTVEHLTQGNVVGWFQGKMEFGPRALGSRSILADPSRKDMKDILNMRIKRRENFRPFAPIVPEERAHEYFKMNCKESPFMLKVFPVREEKRTRLPAITHEDGTARVQTVSKQTNPRLWKLLKEFGLKTGMPILLNTSFNENEPVVCSPDEAIACFQKTKMDLLILGTFCIEKNKQQ